MRPPRGTSSWRAGRAVTRPLCPAPLRLSPSLYSARCGHFGWPRRGLPHAPRGFPPPCFEKIFQANGCQKEKSLPQQTRSSRRGIPARVDGRSGGGPARGGGGTPPLGAYGGQEAGSALAPLSCPLSWSALCAFDSLLSRARSHVTFARPGSGCPVAGPVGSGAGSLEGGRRSVAAALLPAPYRLPRKRPAPGPMRPPWGWSVGDLAARFRTQLSRSLYPGGLTAGEANCSGSGERRGKGQPINK